MSCADCSAPVSGRAKRCPECARLRENAQNAARRRAPGRRCSKCGETKAIAEFPRSKNAHSWCLSCCAASAAAWRAANPEKVKAQRQRHAERLTTDDEYRARVREWQRLQRLLVRYGITAEDFEAMWDRQGGCCAVCRRALERTKGKCCVDHCHESGRVRGLLCYPCNWVLGFARDDPEVLDRARLYLTDGVLGDG